MATEKPEPTDAQLLEFIEENWFYEAGSYDKFDKTKNCWSFGKQEDWTTPEVYGTFRDSLVAAYKEKHGD